MDQTPYESPREPLAMEQKPRKQGNWVLILVAGWFVLCAFGISIRLLALALDMRFGD
jgi:hypothetical protein